MATMLRILDGGDEKDGRPDQKAAFIFRHQIYEGIAEYWRKTDKAVERSLRKDSAKRRLMP